MTPALRAGPAATVLLGLVMTVATITPPAAASTPGILEADVGYTLPTGCTLAAGGTGTSSTSLPSGGPGYTASSGTHTVVVQNGATTSPDFAMLTGRSKTAGRISAPSGSLKSFTLATSGSTSAQKALAHTACGATQLKTYASISFDFHAPQRGVLTLAISETGTGRYYRQSEVFGNGVTFGEHGAGRFARTVKVHLPKAGDYSFFGSWECVATVAQRHHPAASTVRAAIDATYSRS